MGLTYARPNGIKYTDMCIWIDANSKFIKNTNEYPEIEAKVFEYLYHVVYGLSCKYGFFNKFTDYDEFALFAAGDLYMSMKKKLLHAGEKVRGKEVIPIKSSLNFIKATLNPLRINFQNSYFTNVVSEEQDPRVANIGHMLKEDIQREYRPRLGKAYVEVANEIPDIAWDILQHDSIFFRNDKEMTLKLYLSIMLTLVNDLTLPTRIRKKLSKETILASENPQKQTSRFMKAYEYNKDPAILWHLDVRYNNYVKLLATKVKKEFSKRLDYILHKDELSDELLDAVMGTAYATYYDSEDLC